MIRYSIIDIGRIQRLKIDKEAEMVENKLEGKKVRRESAPSSTAMGLSEGQKWCPGATHSFRSKDEKRMSGQHNRMLIGDSGVSDGQAMLDWPLHARFTTGMKILLEKWLFKHRADAPIHLTMQLFSHQCTLRRCGMRSVDAFLTHSTTPSR